MGRFSAPQFVHDYEDDGDQAMPMDWTAIPDDGEDHVGGSLGEGVGSGSGDGESRSLVCYDTDTASGANNGGHAHGEDECIDNFNRDERGHLANDSDNFTHDENHYLREANTINPNSKRSDQSLFLRVAEQCLEQSNNYLEQQQLLEKKRARIRKIMIISVAIIAIVLKRYAPPPPPLFSQYPLATSYLSPNSAADGDVSIDDIIETLPLDKSFHDKTSSFPGATHHETWASYSQHVLHLLHHALAYGLSVAWYAVSNAFCYASEEVRDGFMSLLFQRDGDNSLWNTWKKKLMYWIPTNKVEDNSRAMADTPQQELNKIISCPIRIPAASNLHTHLPRGAATDHNTAGTSRSIAEGWSTEEFLRQTIGTSLSPQNLALKLISEGLDTWGVSLVEEAPVALVHKMATSVYAGPKDRYIDEEMLAEWILPPAAGFLLVGPEGVGKLHTARRLSYFLLGHCLEEASSFVGAPTGFGSIQELDGALEVNADEFDSANDEAHPMKEMIVNHIRGRKGLGSVIIIHHIESMPISVLSELSQVLSGKADSLSHQTSEELVEAPCNGTVFLLTSKQWGTKSIFQHIQQNDGLNRLRRESLVSSIGWEVDSHLDYWSKLASYTTVAPFLPFQQEDLSSILQGKVQALNLKYQGLQWKRLEVLLAALKYFTSDDHVEYLELYNSNDRSDTDDSDSALITFSTSGAHSLNNNPLWQTIRTKLITSSRRRPSLIFKVGLDDKSKETTFSWCNREKGSERCELEWRSLLV